jgi:hypothetical protein
LTLALEKLLRRHRRGIPLRGHKGVFWAAFMNIPPREFMALPLPYGSVTELQGGRRRFQR